MLLIDISLHFQWQKTSLHYAVENGHYNVVKLLYESQADLYIEDDVS